MGVKLDCVNVAGRWMVGEHSLPHVYARMHARTFSSMSCSSYAEMDPSRRPTSPHLSVCQVILSNVSRVTATAQ